MICFKTHKTAVVIYYSSLIMGPTMEPVCVCKRGRGALGYVFFSFFFKSLPRCQQMSRGTTTS